MLDARATALIAPVVNATAKRLHALGCTANALTFAGFGVGMLAALCIAQSRFECGLVLLLTSRLADALDGAVARLSQATDQGGFLDISLDFLFYASIPLAFAIADPQANALAAAVLLAAFMGTGSSFLAFAAIAAKRNMRSTAYPNKSFFFLGGLTEATETLACFVAMCLWPASFAAIALIFAGLCGFTICTRLFWGYRQFDDR